MIYPIFSNYFNRIHIYNYFSYIMDFSKLTVVQLKDELRSRGLKLGGKKAELIARLDAYENSDESVQEAVPTKPSPKSATKKKSPKKTTKPKAVKKSPTEMLSDSIKKANLPFMDSIITLFTVYGLDQSLPEDSAEVWDWVISVKDNTIPVPEPEPVEMTEESLMKLKNADLKEMLKSKGLKVGGNKAEMVERLLAPPPPPPAYEPIPVPSPVSESKVTEADDETVELPAVPLVPATSSPPPPALPPVPTAPTESVPTPVTDVGAEPKTVTPALPTVESPLPSLPTIQPQPHPQLPTMPAHPQLPTVASGLPTLPTTDVGSPDL